MTGYPWSPGDELLAADLNAAIASVAGAGSATAGPITANSQIVTVPAFAMILGMTITETAGHAVTIHLGTTAGASDVLAPVAIAANQLLTVSPMALGVTAWKVSQPLFVAAPSWGGASLNFKVWYAT